MSKTHLITSSAPLTAKQEPLPTPPFNLHDFVVGIADPRMKQTVAQAIYSSASARVVYIAYGVVAKMQAAYRMTTAEPITAADALAALEDDEARSAAMHELGFEYTSRATLIGHMLRIKQDMEQVIQEIWPEFKGRSLDEEFKRSYEVRMTNPEDVTRIFEHFEGEISREDITAGLLHDNATDANANRMKASAATIVLGAVDVAPEDSTLSPEEEMKFVDKANSAIKRLEMDCLTNKARGFSSSIERFACASLCKGLRKQIDGIVKHIRHNKQEAHVSGSNPNGINPAGTPTHANRLAIAAEKRDEDGESPIDAVLAVIQAEPDINIRRLAFDYSRTHTAAETQAYYLSLKPALADMPNEI